MMLNINIYRVDEQYDIRSVIEDDYLNSPPYDVFYIIHHYH